MRTNQQNRRKRARARAAELDANQRARAAYGMTPISNTPQDRQLAAHLRAIILATE